ncbi:rolling circle replication-associated protein [Roseobacter litoralis]|uniref:rolling circle replication-associated protein n=1 Tax=Roseobacter litoralis TaxID=42443 RepID=UPI002493E578|nr:hypothetical protein [Roseobacter litoralis]
MAEMATAKHAVVLNLTYRNRPDGTLPVSARAFQYHDVQIFMKRIRNAAKKHYGKDFELRYLVCGERGSQRNRVHWHVILFSSHNILTLGKWYDFFFKAILMPRPKRMDHWDLWDHGHIVMDEASQASISYTLKYALKDQFNVVKSKGTSRYAKSENNGSAMFRMSKSPPIGWRYLESKIQRLRETLSVPPSTNVNVTRYSGFWWPRGTIREWYLKALAEINDTHREINGRDCPQWNTLLASLSENENDLENLNVIPQDEQETPQELEEEIARKQTISSIASRAEAERNKCGRAHVCEACFNTMDIDTRAEFESWKTFQKHQYGENWFSAFSTERRPNPFCAFRAEKEKYFVDEAYWRT